MPARKVRVGGEISEKNNISKYTLLKKHQAGTSRLAEENQTDIHIQIDGGVFGMDIQISAGILYQE